MALRCTPSGELNFYEEPINYTAFALNYNKVYDRSQSVLIRDNLLELPIRFTIEQFAYRLANAERTIDVNINSQKTPVMIQGSDKQMLSLKTLYSQYEGNTPVLFADKDLNRENLKVFKTDSPYVADKLQNYKHQIYNEALTFLGIDNANTDKKERLITDEVESNNHNLSMSLQSRLLTRKMACKEINEKYDLNIDVNVRENLFPTIKKEGITKNE
jgi:hypothetical protein